MKKREISNVEGIVEERMKYFENLQLNNDSSSNKMSFSRNPKLKKLNGLPYYSAKNNNDNTGDLTTINHFQNEDNGYLEKKPKSRYIETKEEKEVIKRLKDREREHLNVQRYKSILRAPLSQQVVVNKYKVESKGTSKASQIIAPSSKVASNHELLSNKHQESLIDIALLNSITQSRKSSLNADQPIKMLQMLKDKRAIRWSDIEMVQSSKLLSQLSQEDVMFQESQFELIASEASYYRSLNVLVDRFYHSPLLYVDCVNNETDSTFHMKAHQKEHLFSNILQIHSISGKFLATLEKRFASSIVITDICDIVSKYAESDFNVYITYLQNQKFQNEAYMDLKKDEEASKIIETLENQVECCGLTLDSFLILPMQRLFRILLLLKAIKDRIPQENTSYFKSVDKAIFDIEKVINQCSIKKGLMDERQRMLEISRSLIFKHGQPLISISSGTLIYEGEVKCWKQKSDIKKPLVKVTRTRFESWMILTDEYLLITKLSKSKDHEYVVKQWSHVVNVSLQDISPVWLFEGKVSRQFSLVFSKSNSYTIETKSRDDYNKWILELSVCGNS